MSRTVAYLMSRFPKISETFVLYEILALQRLGLHIEIFSLVHHKEEVVHLEAQAVSDRVHYGSLVSRAMLAAQLYWLYMRPGAYLRAWWQAIRGNITSLKFLVRALAVVPKASLFARQMQVLGVEHVHAHWATHPTLAAYVVHRLTGLPYSFTAHANDIFVKRPMLDEKIRQAKFVITISEYNRQFLQNLYGSMAADKTVIIHCGIDPEVFKPPKSRSEQFTIICVASLEEKKGHTYLIEACARLKAQNIEFLCLLVGDGPARSQIKAQVDRLNLEEHVILLGYQPRHLVSQLLREASLMVLPSVTARHGRKEGIPVALMEALAVEMPVIATAISGIPELIENERTGLLVPERDSAAIAAALLRLYKTPQLGRQLGSAGRAKVLQDFNLRRNAAALYDLFAPQPVPTTAWAEQYLTLKTVVGERESTCRHHTN